MIRAHQWIAALVLWTATVAHAGERVVLCPVSQRCARVLARVDAGVVALVDDATLARAPVSLLYLSRAEWQRAIAGGADLPALVERRTAIAFADVGLAVLMRGQARVAARAAAEPEAVLARALQMVVQAQLEPQTRTIRERLASLADDTALAAAEARSLATWLAPAVTAQLSLADIESRRAKAAGELLAQVGPRPALHVEHVVWTSRPDVRADREGGAAYMRLRGGAVITLSDERAVGARLVWLDPSGFADAQEALGEPALRREVERRLDGAAGTSTEAAGYLVAHSLYLIATARGLPSSPALSELIAGETRTLRALAGRADPQARRAEARALAVDAALFAALARRDGRDGLAADYLTMRDALLALAR